MFEKSTLKNIQKNIKGKLDIQIKLVAILISRIQLNQEKRGKVKHEKC